MIRPIAVLRPEPGNAATAARIARRGRVALTMPLFRIEPLAWTPPDPARFDAIVLTSANTLRHAGAALDLYRRLPSFAVGEATANAAREMGFAVAFTGEQDAVALGEALRRSGSSRALHLGGRDRALTVAGPIRDSVAVYASNSIDPGASTIRQLSGCVVVAHSARTGRWLGELLDAHRVDRTTIAVAAISDAVDAALGGGWRARLVAAVPTDAALLTAAIALDD